MFFYWSLYVSRSYRPIHRRGINRRAHWVAANAPLLATERSRLKEEGT